MDIYKTKIKTEQGQDKNRARGKAGGKAGKQDKGQDQAGWCTTGDDQTEENMTKGWGFIQEMDRARTKFCVMKTRPRKVVCLCCVHVMFMI